MACESSVKSDNETDYVWVYGEVTPLPPPEVVQELVRKTLTSIGYTSAKLGTSAETAVIEVRLAGQSADIALGVDKSLEAKEGDTTDLDTGAGDEDDDRLCLRQDTGVHAGANRAGPPLDAPARARTQETVT